MENFMCSVCNQSKPRGEFYERSPSARCSRPVTYDCKVCKADRDRGSEKWNAAFKKWGTVCKTCHQPRRLVTDGQCSTCLRDLGLKQCRTCKEVKLMLVEFYENRGSCIECWKKVRPASNRKSYRGLSKSEKIRAKALWQYGLTSQSYDALLVAQENKCAICDERFEKSPNVDHDHSTGEVRGLLCTKCNVGLGMFRDSPVRLRKAAAYINRAREACLSRPSSAAQSP